MKKEILSVCVVLSLISLVFSCTNDNENNPGIETDPELGKSLKELAEKNPNIIRRNDTIPSDKFTFLNVIFYSSTKDSIILHSFDFNSTGDERVLVRFSNKELAIATHSGVKEYKSSDYKITILGSDNIRVVEKYTNKFVFQGRCIARM